MLEAGEGLKPESFQVLSGLEIVSVKRNEQTTKSMPSDMQLHTGSGLFGQLCH